ncbi:PorT family protein [Bizionia gelidisalsuginis]|uniref:PorT family protein n=1 Tax=Bizionia gelidisalsuginis TaxID=291188 RepID=A0ABY3M9H6_9FLAO|nr:porin family protein [Bizionia gelidisalsuginis]TYC11407.1 PorT family protein [Bizionia gelidisalsuginis]
MRYFFPLALCLLFGIQVYAQEDVFLREQIADSLYKEDQFYIGVTYNLLGKQPSGISQSGFSSGYHFGFIKDIPINKRRNSAIGVGLGVSINSFNQNLLITETTRGTMFSVLDRSETSYTKNKFSSYMLELPLEYRWRTSTSREYKFWRVYTGVKFGYVFANQTKFKGEPTNISLNNKDVFNEFQYGLTMSAGYNTWNFYIYYALNPIFNASAKLKGDTIDMNAIKIGLIFYIL